MNPAVQFAAVSIGRMFHLNGNNFVKQSSRTARMLSNGRVFYISRADNVYLIKDLP